MTDTLTTESTLTIGEQRRERFTCAKHGEHDAMLYLTFFKPLPEGTANLHLNHIREVERSKHYCLFCWEEQMDAAGVLTMKPIETE